MPTSVKIGYQVYKIEDWQARGAYASDRYGECSHGECIIRVSRAWGTVKAANTLLHEILHAVCNMMSRPHEAGEELTVSMIADGLCTVWVDNPAVFRWIYDGLESGGY